MESDNDSYNEESSDAEEVAGPLHMNVNVNINEPPVSLATAGVTFYRSSSSDPGTGTVAGVELPNDGNNSMNLFNRADIVELKN